MVEDAAICFLRDRGEVLLVREGPGAPWDAVSASVSEHGPEAAREALAEAVADPDAPTLVRWDGPFGSDPDADETDRRLSAYLFDCDREDVTVRDDALEREWVPATDVRRRDAVSGLWTGYDRVAPTATTVEDEYEYGSAYLSVRALEVLRNAAAAAREDGDWEDVARLAGTLVEAQPTMAVVRNRINRVMSAAAPERSLETVEREAHRGIERALTVDAEAASNAVPLLSDARAFTVSLSGTVLSALREASVESVVVTESRTDDEGVTAAEALADNVDVELTIDAASAHLLSVREFDCVVVGADAILPDGSVVNKVGTRATALAAAREDVPVYAVAAGDKIQLDDEPRLERRPAEAVYDGDADVAVTNPVFDVTPPDLLDRVVTERGALTTEEAAALAADLESMADWRAVAAESADP